MNISNIIDFNIFDLEIASPNSRIIFEEGYYFNDGTGPSGYYFGDGASHFENLKSSKFKRKF